MPRLLSSTEVSDYLQVSVKTLDEWASGGTGPRYSRVGKYRRYRREDIERWLDERAPAR